MQLDSSSVQTAATGLEPFLKGWGSLIIATVALLLPGAIALWKKFFRPGSVDVYESGPIDVSYGPWGPCLGLRGTLRAVHRDQFIRNIQLTVVKEKDNSTHVLDWLLFRAEKITGLGTEDISAEIATGFMLLTTQPHRYSILFTDTATQNELKPHVEGLQAAWADYEREPATVAALLAKKDIYSPFIQSGGIHTETWAILERRMYWEPGRYSLEMRVQTTRPERTFTRKWRFQITQEEFERLRLNALVLCHVACGQTSNYYFTHAQYQAVLPGA